MKTEIKYDYKYRYECLNNGIGYIYVDLESRKEYFKADNSNKYFEYCPIDNLIKY